MQCTKGAWCQDQCGTNIQGLLNKQTDIICVQVNDRDTPYQVY